MPEEIKPKTSFFLKLLENFKTNRLWQAGGIAVIVIFACSYAYTNIKNHLRHETKFLITEDKGRELFKEKDLQRPNKANILEERITKPEHSKPIKRNYSTDMAVFIFKEEKERSLSHPSMRTEKVKLGLPAGTKIATYTAGTIFSFNVATPVTVVVSKDIEKNGKVIIPKDSQFLGEAGVIKSLNRINVNFDLLILPDGREMRVRAMALSEDGSSGIKGRVSKHQDKRVLKALGETVLAGAAIFGRGGVSNDPYSLEDRFRENAFDNLTGMAREDLRNTKVETSIIVDSFTSVQVILLEAV